MRQGSFQSACLVRQLCSLCARRGICALRLCTWLSRCRRRFLSRLNTLAYYTRSTSPLPMASSHSGPHVYLASLQHHSIQRCRRVFRQQLVSIVWLASSYAFDRDDFQQNQVGGLRTNLLNVRSGHYSIPADSTSGSGVWNIFLYILLVLDNARLPPFHHTFARIASSLISNRILKLELYSIGKDLIGR